MAYPRKGDAAPDDLMNALPVRGPSDAGKAPGRGRGRLMEMLSARGISKNAVRAAAAIAAVVVVVAAVRWAPALANGGLVIEPGGSAGQQEVQSGGSGGDGGSGAAASPASGDSPEGEAPSEIYVHVAGAVASPGVYALQEGARVADAVALAGGLAPDASDASVNLAREVADGEQVYVPTLDEAAQGAAPSGAGAAGAQPSGGGASQLVNINAATADQLEELPGIGPSTAAAIVSHREENGPFASKEDIQNVSGIGAGKYAKIESLICV